MRCPFCSKDLVNDAPFCDECGYRFTVPAAPAGKLELTDEQALALAGFHSAQADRIAENRLSGSANIQLGRQRTRKIVMFFLTVVLIPSALGWLYGALNGHAKASEPGHGQFAAGPSSDDVSSIAQDLAAKR